MSRKKMEKIRYVPSPGDPEKFSDFLLNMEAYWRYWWTLRKGGLKKKFSVTAIVLFAIDYLRYKLITFVG